MSTSSSDIRQACHGRDRQQHQDRGEIVRFSVVCAVGYFMWQDTSMTAVRPAVTTTDSSAVHGGVAGAGSRVNWGDVAAK